MLRLYLNLLGVLFEVKRNGRGRGRGEGVAPVCLSVKNFRLLFSLSKILALYLSDTLCATPTNAISCAC